MDVIPTDNDSTPEPTLASPILPNEVIENVIQQMSDPSTLATMMRVSRRMYEVAAPRLYCEVDMTARNAGQLYAGLGACQSLEPGLKEVGEKRKRSEFDEEGMSTTSGQGTSPPPSRWSKRELIAMIQHLNIHDIPPIEVCQRPNPKAAAQGVPHPHKPMTISIRPRAAWQLMDCFIHRYNGPHPFILFLRQLDCEHLCIQIPVMDQAVEAHHLRVTIPQYKENLSPHHFGWRQRLSAALIGHTDENGGTFPLTFFDLLRPGYQSVTVHNLTMAMSNYALASVDSSVGTFRAFCRPCVTADVELVDKVRDRHCINHRSKIDIATGGVWLGPKALSGSTNVDFIDIDWVRGKYTSERDSGALRQIEDIVESQVQGTPEADRVGWGEKSFKMAKDAESCRCCQKGQLTVAEVSQYRALISGLYKADRTELDPIHRLALAGLVGFWHRCE